eukprot:CAMPEP_0119297858 /NCGR_PEP_ID=MMETSP1333-20130426/48_1 /TAXON_ID=418940 /ORGANISM="Scyphosphaera apsteinii, Strain RCC1455" /LENGTH=838 /DNA_ID=CAMNT_0007298807 /DNA_START=30 /DNA_END=2547 /DNA_ORIENTATION=+
MVLTSIPIDSRHIRMATVAIVAAVAHGFTSMPQRYDKAIECTFMFKQEDHFKDGFAVHYGVCISEDGTDHIIPDMSAASQFAPYEKVKLVVTPGADLNNFKDAKRSWFAKQDNIFTIKQVLSSEPYQPIGLELFNEASGKDEHSVIFARLSWDNDPMSCSEACMLDVGRRVNEFYMEMSYNLMHWTFDVATIPMGEMDVKCNIYDGEASVMGRVRATLERMGKPINDFSHVVLVMPSSYSNLCGRVGGEGYVGCATKLHEFHPMKSMCSAVVFEADDLSEYDKFIILLHELSHNLGLKHATSGDFAIPNTVNGYGDKTDVMGNPRTVFLKGIPLQHSGAMREMVGWVPAGAVFRIDETDATDVRFTVRLNKLSLAAQNVNEPAVIKIRVPGERKMHYFVSYNDYYGMVHVQLETGVGRVTHDSCNMGFHAGSEGTCMLSQTQWTGEVGSFLPVSLTTYMGSFSTATVSDYSVVLCEMTDNYAEVVVDISGADASCPSQDALAALDGPSNILDLSNAEVEQSSEHWKWIGPASRAVSSATPSPFWGDGTCTNTKPERNPWWSVKLPSTSTVQSIIILNRGDSPFLGMANDARTSVIESQYVNKTLAVNSNSLNRLSIFVDDTECASNLQFTYGARTEVPCSATGQEVKMVLSGERRQLVLCEVKVKIAVTAPSPPAPPETPPLCAVGEGSGPKIAVSRWDIPREKCAAKCDAADGCVAFDYSSGYRHAACRLFSEDNPNLGNGGPHGGRIVVTLHRQVESWHEVGDLVKGASMATVRRDVYLVKANSFGRLGGAVLVGLAQERAKHSHMPTGPPMSLSAPQVSETQFGTADVLSCFVRL